ncbi:hypothetical protein [Deinococcus soli (ex Cha et al. 2016)]|uniref:hypothetical protein n=1 Tax=Deinococcus soli (ex Cha et al. 2016) TaxID=1309411 RepID=UPI00166918C1|nr:hypothetical protein [Deinococcus soli (ex Cha et al. 2016)]GGB71082.1 hypothetical protein GCM10008019_29090 [Deinococcus soli (ex Cha et al. 2016)]
MSWFDAPPALDISLPTSLKDPIVIFEGEGSLFGGAPEGLSVQLKLWPDPALTATGQPIPTDPQGDAHGQLTIPGFEATDALPIRWSAEARAYLLTRLVRGAATVSTLDFWVVNGPTWLGQWVKEPKGIRRARLILTMGPFLFTLDHVPTKVLDDAEAEGHMFAVTAVGRVQRSDGAPFQTDDPDLDHAFDALGWGFSFAQGRWVGAGTWRHATTEQGPWIAAEVTRISRYRPSTNWYHRHNEDGLQQVCEGLYPLLRDATWTTSLRTVMGLYIDAHSEGNVVSQLISAQVALETLSWTELTEVRKLKSKRQFKSGNAAVHLTELLQAFGIGANLPAQTQELSAFLQAEDQRAALHKQAREAHHAPKSGPSGQPTCPDQAERPARPEVEPAPGPRAIVAVRNSYVHPSSAAKLQALTERASSDLVDLALTYVELCVLRLLEVQGTYAPRFQHDEQPLPWTITADTPEEG